MPNEGYLFVRHAFGTVAEQGEEWGEWHELRREGGEGYEREREGRMRAAVANKESETS